LHAGIALDECDFAAREMAGQTDAEIAAQVEPQVRTRPGKFRQHLRQAGGEILRHAEPHEFVGRRAGDRPRASFASARMRRVQLSRRPPSSVGATRFPLRSSSGRPMPSSAA